MCVPPQKAVDVVKTAFSAGKKALEIANELNNVELKSAILDLKEEILALREENLLLRQELSEKQKYNMQFMDNKYWNVKEDGTKDGPFCVTCWDYNKTASRLIDGDWCGICITGRDKKIKG